MASIPNPLYKKGDKTVPASVNFLMMGRKNGGRWTLQHSNKDSSVGIVTVIPVRARDFKDRF